MVNAIPAARPPDSLLAEGPGMPMFCTSPLHAAVTPIADPRYPVIFNRRLLRGIIQIARYLSRL